MARTPKKSKKQRAGAALEALVARRLTDAGYTVEVARPTVYWAGHRCRACGRPPIPRTIAHDMFGCVDVLAFHATRGWTAVQCGGAGSQASKRRALDGRSWPSCTTLMVVTPDGRKGSTGVRVWRRAVYQDTDTIWREAQEIEA